MIILVGFENKVRKMEAIDCLYTSLKAAYIILPLCPLKSRLLDSEKASRHQKG